MTLRELKAIEKAITNATETENAYCERYIELNPHDRERRQDMKAYVLLGIEMAKQEIYRELNIK